MAVIVALVLGSMQGAAVGAWKAQAHTSIGVRTQAQSDLCFVSGGTFSSSTNPFGSTTTTCTGGKNEQQCVNTTKTTTCNPLYIPPPPSPGDGLTSPGDNGVSAADHRGHHHHATHHGQR